MYQEWESQADSCMLILAHCCVPVKPQQGTYSVNTIEYVKRRTQELNTELSKLQDELVTLEAKEVLEYLKKKNYNYRYMNPGLLAITVPESDQQELHAMITTGGFYHGAKDLDPESLLNIQVDDGYFKLGFMADKLLDVVNKYKFNVDFSEGIQRLQYQRDAVNKRMADLGALKVQVQAILNQS